MAQKILIRFHPDKKSASVRQADGPKNLNPIYPDKKSASVRQGDGP